jgi:hypothetical protein
LLTSRCLCSLFLRVVCLTNSEFWYLCYFVYCNNQKVKDYVVTRNYVFSPFDILVVILALSLQHYPFQPKLEDGEDEDINKMISELRKRLHDQVTWTTTPNNMSSVLIKFKWTPYYSTYYFQCVNVISPDPCKFS